MADTELTQLEPKITTTSVTCSDTIFGYGNKLLDPVLLQRLQNTPPLSAVQAANLATFISAYPGNKCLADHLAQFALVAVVTDERVLPTAQEITAPLDFGDWLEDFLDGGDEPSDGLTARPQDGSRQKSLYNQIFALSLVSSLALLVESRTDDYKMETSYFVIGVSPDPAYLPSQSAK